MGERRKEESKEGIIVVVYKSTPRFLRADAAFDTGDFDELLEALPTLMTGLDLLAAFTTRGVEAFGETVVLLFSNANLHICERVCVCVRACLCVCAPALCGCRGTCVGLLGVGVFGGGNGGGF